MSSLQNAIHIQRRSGFGLGLLAGSAVTALWVVLSIWTGLIFHFHPSLVGAGTAWGFKRSGIDVAAVSMSTLLATALVTVGAFVIANQGGALDPWWFIGLETAAGVALGIAIPWRRDDPERADDDRSEAQERNAT